MNTTNTTNATNATNRAALERVTAIIQAATLGAASYKPSPGNSGRVTLAYLDGREIDILHDQCGYTLRVFAGGCPAYWLHLPATACPQAIHRACQRALVETVAHFPISPSNEPTNR